MQNFWSYAKELGAIEIFIITCIVIFFLSTLLFVFLILSSRVKKIRREDLRKKNTAHINKTLFKIAFDEARFDDFKKDQKFSKNWKRKFYREQFLTELIKLHRLYDGEIARNLRRCYTDSRLIQLSYTKIRNRKWEIKCAGIQELSEMEIKKAIPVILKHTESRNETLKMVALIEVIYLSGLEGISLLKNYQGHLNDWIQLNLLDSIKTSGSDNVPDFGYILESKNESIVVFGLRLLKIFHQNQHLSAVKKLQTSSSRRIQLQAAITYEQLTKTSGESLSDKAEAYESQYIKETFVKEKQKESYSRKILLIVLSSILVILGIVASYLFTF